MIFSFIRSQVALDHSFVPILFFFPWIPNPHRTKCINARNLFTKIFQEVIDERTEKQKTDPNYETPKDFLQVLMEAKYRDGKVLTTTEITGILIGVLLGGQHTSNVTGTWFLSHLLKDPQWLQKVLDEQGTFFGNDPEASLHPATLNFQQCQEMPIFDQVLSETLRLHPPFFQLSRSVKVASTFQGKVIPEGHIVNISPGAAHRLPQLWGDQAETFDPERFTSENIKQQKPFSYVPFGGGMHQCGGRKFAWNSLKVSLTWLLRNYEMEFVGKGATELPKEDYTTMVVAPSSSHCRVKYCRRRRTTAATSG